MMVSSATSGGGGDGVDDVRQLLSSSVGVSPSEEWLTACRLHLREREPGGTISNDEVDADAVLHQILHSDLRDVVEPMRRRGSGDDGVGGRSSELRSAVSRSIGGLRTDAATGSNSGASGSMATTDDPSNGSRPRSSTNNRVVLPATFSCLVQVEELLDVSRNAEDRLKHGPAAASSPTPTGDQSRRCLKLALTDGYDNDRDDDRGGRGEAAAASETEMIIGMEVSPLQNLSVHSQPGIKVLLRGPLTIRCGVVMLHGGNATVLGGCVPALIPIQKKAMEMAARVAGVGVDPTVRALVWNPEGADDDEEGKDEGEGESRDVEVARPPQRQQPAPAPAPVPTIVSLSAVAPREGGTAEGPSPVPVAAAPAVPTGSGSNNHLRPSNNRGPAPNSGGRGGAASSTSRAQQRNPYAASGSAAGASGGNRPMTGPSAATGSSASGNLGTGSAAGVSTSASASASAANPATTHHLPPNHPRPGSAGGFTTPRNPYASRSSGSAPSSSTSSRLGTASSARMEEDEEEKGDDDDGTALSSAGTKTHRRPSPSSSTMRIPAAGAVADDVGSTPFETTPSSRGFDYGEDAHPPETTSSSSSAAPQPTGGTSSSSAVAAVTSNNVDHRQSAATATTTPTPIPTPSLSSAISSSTSSSATALASAAAAPSLSARGRSPTALTVPLSFVEFRDLLLRIAVDPDLYDEYEDRVFVVPCKMLERGDRLDFNIVKRKNSSSGGGGGGGAGGGKQKKYEYIMICAWGGPCSDEGTITCNITSGLLEPFFGRPPGELRKMNRGDRTRAQKIVHDGGRSILDEYKTLASFRMKLALPRRKFFATSSAARKDGTITAEDLIDRKTPIAVVVGRD